MSLFEHLKSGFLEGFEFARNEAGNGLRAVEEKAETIAHHPGASLKAAGSWLYDQALGADLKTLTNRNASTLEKVLAGVSIASNFVGPEGKLLDKGLTIAAKEIFRRGGEKLLESGTEQFEVTVGKDTIKELAERGGTMSKSVIKGMELAEKAIDKLNISRDVKDSLTNAFEDGKATSEDFKAALHAKPQDRATAWAEVAKDFTRDGKDLVGIIVAAKRVADARPSEKPALARLQQNATSTLLQDAEKSKGANGRTFIEGADLIIDVRTSKNFLASTDAMLKTMNAEATDSGKHLVVYAPNISEAQERKLRVEGIFVAKTGRDLTELSVATKVPGDFGIRFLELEKQITGNETSHALYQRKETRETVEALAGAQAFVKSGPAEVGRFHESATEWDGKERHFGSISWARDGEVQQYDRGKWIQYRESQLEGDKPIEGRAVSIKADPARPGIAIVSDPLQHEPTIGRTQAPETAPTR
jgi:hypothetical protein